MFSDTLISPKSDQSIRTRYSDIKRRTGSPNFRDILRQRCRERVKARRHNLFDHLRSLENEESVRDAISQFIKMDVEDIKSPNVPEACAGMEDEEVYDYSEEPLSQLAVTEQEKFILEEYERMIENTNIQAELEDMVTCPMCTRGALKLEEDRQVVVCTMCSLLLPSTMPLADLERQIIQVVEIHGQFCREQPQFLICSDESTSNLLLLCSECGQCHQIV